MPTTPNYGLPYPALTDPPNGPANLESLAGAVETAMEQQRADILAALSVTAGTVTPPDDAAQVTAHAWEDWGSTATRVTIAAPGKAVHVFGIVTGHGFNGATSGNFYSSIRVAVSMDGGATWTYGNAPREQSATNSSWAASTSIHLASGTPSGDVLIKAQHQSSSVDTRFFNGRVVGIALHQ